MEKLIFENEEYYFNKGVVYDSSFLEVPLVVAQKVLKEYYSAIDYKEFVEDDYLNHVKHLKTSGFYAECLNVAQQGLEKFPLSKDFARVVFPIITSCYRALGQSQNAIDYWKQNRSKYSECRSAVLLTSLAAAYCDVGDYESAKRCADRAYTMQGGGKGYQNELSLVYQRIDKERASR